MPVDEDFNLDSPEGISEADIVQMNEEADELERIAERAEIAKNKIEASGFNKLNFAQMNILEGMANTRTTDSNGGMSNMSQEEMIKLVVELLEASKEAKEERKEIKSDQQKLEEEQKKAEMERRKLEAEIVGDLKGGEGQFYTFMSATNNPSAFGLGKIKGMVGKAGIVGVVIMIVWKMGEFLYKQWEDSFKAGGANDVRKLIDDRSREIIELNDMLERRNGRVFYTADVDLRQGVPQYSNTERLRDQMIRYQALHLGE